MPKKTVSVEVESSGLELCQALTAIVVAARSKNGGASAALSAALGQIMNIVKAVESLPSDAKEDIWEFEKGFALGSSELMKAAFGPQG